MCFNGNYVGIVDNGSNAFYKIPPLPPEAFQRDAFQLTKGSGYLLLFSQYVIEIDSLVCHFYLIQFMHVLLEMTAE